MSLPKPRDGYSLLELSVVLVLIGLIAAAGLTAGSQMLESVRRTQTTNKLDVIEDALMSFRSASNRLPCPADATLATTNANYGAEAANPGACTGGAPAANQTDAANNVVEGAVPFKGLNLPAEFMYDGWGRKFVYAVNFNVTGTMAMLGQSLNDQGKITITDASGNYRTKLVYSTTGGTYYTPASALYALVSYGSDGHGGYLKGGTRYSSGSTDANELANCHCNSSAVEGVYSASYVQMDVTTTFGDFVRYKDRWQMQTFDDTSVSHLGMVTTLGTLATGINAGEEAGWALAVGDVNGDGIADLIIGAPYANGESGSVYVVFGTKTGFPNPLPLSSLNGNNGFLLNGVSAWDEVGNALAVGDVNGDGIADIIIQAVSGYVYVVFGHAGAWPASQTLTTGVGTLIDGTKGFRLDSPGAGNEVMDVASGDINGDGKADIIMGAPYAPAGGNTGYTYVVFGKSGAWNAPTGTITLNTGAGNIIDGTQGFRLDGPGSDSAGGTVAAGDINNDGKSDLIILAPLANGNKGYAYIVFGKSGTWNAPTGTITLNTGAGNIIDGTQGFRLDGTYAGQTLAAATTGDINGDGNADIIIGDYQANFTGSVYVVFGHGPPWPVSQTLTTGIGNLLDGTQGFRIDGGNPASGDSLGFSLATADVNNDGKADLIIGGPGAADDSSKGYTYLVYGKAGSWTSPQPLTPGAGNFINGINGFRLDGVDALDNIGDAVAIGDVNGDGIPDIITGGYKAVWPNNQGYIYVAYGRPVNATWPATSLLSTLK